MTSNRLTAQTIDGLIGRQGHDYPDAHGYLPDGSELLGKDLRRAVSCAA